MEKKQDWEDTLKADPTEWLMEDDNPVVRYWTLRGLVDASPSEVEAARQQASESDVVQEVFRQQRPEGHWENPDNMHAPHYTSTVYQLTLLGDLGPTADDERIVKGVEAVLKTQRDDGGFPGHDPGNCAYGPYDIGLIIRFMHQFGMGDDPRLELMYDWIEKNQMSGGGWVGVKTSCNPVPGGCLNGTANVMWGMAATTYAILRLLALGESPSDQRIQRAAEWLLNLPETPPRPGMWMLTEEYLDEWMSRRQPREQRVLAAGEIIRAHPREDVSFYCWQFHESEQDQFRGQEVQQVIPACARHHPPACEPRITHVSAIAAEALMRCGYHDHPRMRRYINTLFHVGGAWGYWCGCGALGYYDPDIPASESGPNFNVRMAAEDGATDMSPWRWVPRVSRSAVLANKTSLPNKDTHLIPFSWYCIPGEDAFALVGTGWQNGDCWAKTNRAISQHPSFPGSLAEHLAIYQASRYQTSLGEWDQGFPAGMLAFLSLYDHSAVKSLVIKTIPWLREHQAEDGLWHHEDLPQDEWGKLTEPPEPRLATYHIIAALHKFGLLERLLA